MSVSSSSGPPAQGAAAAGESGDSPAEAATPGGSGPETLPAERLLGLFRRLTRSMTRPAEQSRLMQTILEGATALLGGSGAALFTPDPHDARILLTRLGTGSLAEREGELLPAEGSFEGRALQGGRPQHSDDLSIDPRAYRPRERRLGMGPALALPLVVDTRPVATLLIGRSVGEPDFSPTDLEVATAAAEGFSAALQNSRVFERARDSRADLEAWRREQQLLGWFAAHQVAHRAEGLVVFRLDVASGDFDWGSALPAVTGYQPAEFGATLAEWSERVYQEDRGRVREEVERARRSGEAASVQFRLFHQSGVYRYAALRIFVADEAASAQRVGVLQDVTERERLASQRDLRARAGAASEIIRALRHEINNPLSVVIGQVQLMQKDPAVTGNPTLQQSLRAIHEESVRMHDLLRRLATLEQHPREPFVSRSGGVNLPGGE